MRIETFSPKLAPEIGVLNVKTSDSGTFLIRFSCGDIPRSRIFLENNFNLNLNYYLELLPSEPRL